MSEFNETVKNKPIHKFKMGVVNVAVWENVRKDKQGKEFAVKSINFSRSYKEGDEWKETSSFRNEDLPKLALLSVKCYNAINEIKF